MKQAELRSEDKKELLSVTESDSLQLKIGQLLWVTSQTRPDASYETCQLGSKLKNGRVHANKIIRSLKAQDVGLHYENLGDDSTLKLVVYANAAHGNLPDGGNQGGYFIFLVGQNRKCSLLSWQSKKIQRTVHSSLAAEILSLSNAVDTTVFLNKMFSEIYFGGQKDLPIEVITDNQSLYDALYSCTCKSISERRLRIDIGMLKK